ncbi:Tad domain-containing protein [uncultured Nocardioides sp.]|uniref:TadE/TadG family type IV pilus assembly protein n=1 Tax=uncultured Nocardioides sp. TaxID=198441 RepID=UPI00261AB107|nr:Tad domain-containing protein [uncultured Nocardioides sp.]
MSRRPSSAPHPGRRSRDDRGAVAVLTGLVSVVLLIVAGFAVDIGNTWARRGQLQVQADRAATYAAQFLPADSAAEQLELAKGVAFYYACHAVQGQRQLDASIPACPADPSSSTLDAYAQDLLDDDMVTFPVRNQVKVVTPWARIDYGFGRAAGADGSTQRKTATARVTSPGMLSPMALSLDCLLDVGANVLGGAGVPFGYISTTHQGSGASTTSTTWPGTYTYVADPQLNGIAPGRINQQLLGPYPTVQVSGSQWPVLGANQRYVSVFRQGSTVPVTQEVGGNLVLDAGNNRRRVGHIPVTVPALVAATTGTWQVKVVVENLVAGVPVSRTYSTDTSTFDVDPLVSTTDVSCGRLLKSPRAGTQANINFVHNLQEGVDHLIDQHPSLVSLGTSLDDLDLAELSTLLGLTECAGTDVKDTNGLQPGETPTCVVTNMSNAYEAGFTPGMIGSEGRLACTADNPCRPGKSFSFNGVALNNDLFTDFVNNTSLLTSDIFFDLDTYLDTSLPVVTPQSNLSREIYNSHRFMWVAVVSTAGAVSAVQAGDYPVVTFRPIFITQSSALSGVLPLLDTGLLSLLVPTLQSALSLLDTSMRTLLQPGLTDQNGLLVDSSNNLSAVRFMTITPDALPAVPADYAGPEAEYLGVGPRIIRLVE